MPAAAKRARNGKRMTLKQAAQELGITTQAISKASGEGRVRVHRHAGRVFISEAENLNYFRELRARRDALREANDLPTEPTPST